MSELTQLRDYCDFLDEVQGEIDLSDVVRPVAPGDGFVREHREPRKWLAAAAAAAAVFVLVGGVAALERIQDSSQIAPVVEDPTPIDTDTPVTETITPDDNPVAEPAEPPVVIEAEPNTPRLAMNVPVGVESGTIDTPLGPARWVHLPHDGATPHDASAVPWPSGFAAFSGPTHDYDPALDEGFRLSPAALWVSVDGVEWSTIPVPVPPTAERALLDHVDGVYWLTSRDPDSPWQLWRSADAANWDELDIARLGPEPAGLYAPSGPPQPTSAGGLTVIPVRFEARFPITEFVVGAGDGECGSQVSLHRLGSDRFRVAKAVGEGEGPYCPPQPVLRMVETEVGLDALVDETGEKLGTIEGAVLDDMALVVGDDLDESERLLIVRGGEVTSIHPPWSAPTQATLFGVGEFVYAYVESADGVDIAVWRTENGTNWTDLGPIDLPQVTGRNAGYQFNVFTDGRLGAWSNTASHGAWESVDGINWEKANLGPPPHGLTGNEDAEAYGPGLLRPTESRWMLDNGTGMWIDFDGEWVSLADLELPSASAPWHRSMYGSANTTYIVTEEIVPVSGGGYLAYSLWIVNLEPTD